jgi:hypothetical protein
MPSVEILESGAAALLFAAVFLAGGHVHPLRALVRDRRTLVSFAAGASAAYVFVHLMPELHGARAGFARSVSIALQYEGMAIYFVALVGFLAFYGLDHLLGHADEEPGGAPKHDGARGFRIHAGGFAAYVLLVSYLLVRNLEERPVSLALFALAMACHFLGVDHSMREDHGARYDRVGRFVLAGMALAGWGAGLLLPLPPYALALLVAFVSGGVIMNSAVMELPSDKDGRFVPFLLGGLTYGLVLIPLG